MRPPRSARGRAATLMTETIIDEEECFVRTMRMSAFVNESVNSVNVRSQQRKLLRSCAGLYLL